jgi:hypothetical protein
VSIIVEQFVGFTTRARSRLPIRFESLQNGLPFGSQVCLVRRLVSFRPPLKDLSHIRSLSAHELFPTNIEQRQRRARVRFSENGKELSFSWRPHKSSSPFESDVICRLRFMKCVNTLQCFDLSVASSSQPAR